MLGSRRTSIAVLAAASAIVVAAGCGAEHAAPLATPPPPPSTTVAPEPVAVATPAGAGERRRAPDEDADADAADADIDVAADARGAAGPVVTSAPSPTSTLPAPIAPASWAAFDRALSSRLLGGGDFAAAVAVAVDGRVVHRAQFGHRVPVADPLLLGAGSAVPAGVASPGGGQLTAAPRPAPEPIEAGDRFRIASISKIITAVVVLQLVEAGQLGLDETVGERLADHVGVGLDPAVAGITVRHLLTHTSGLPVHRNVFFGGGADSCQGAAQAGLTRGLSGPPGSSYRYSNMNYCLLGLLVEDLAGRPYEAVVTDRLLAPLGIQGMRLATTFDPDPALVVHPSVPDRNYMEVLGAAGAWVATPAELVTIMGSLDPDAPGWQPLSRPMLELMRRPPATSPSATAAPAPTGRWYGLGLISYGEGSFGHTGTLENTHAMVVARPDGVVWAVTVSGEFPWESSDLRAIFDRSIADAGIRLS